MMDALAILAIISPCLGLALLLGFGTLKIILWSTALRNEQ
jgi:hypothetical protein